MITDSVSFVSNADMVSKTNHREPPSRSPPELAPRVIEADPDPSTYLSYRILSQLRHTVVECTPLLSTVSRL